MGNDDNDDVSDHTDDVDVRLLTRSFVLSFDVSVYNWNHSTEAAAAATAKKEKENIRPVR